MYILVVLGGKGTMRIRFGGMGCLEMDSRGIGGVVRHDFVSLSLSLSPSPLVAWEAMYRVNDENSVTD